MPRSGKRSALLTALLVLATAGLLSAADNALTPQEKAAGWILLFDGKTLDGWEASVPAPPAANSAPKKAKAPAVPGAAPAQGSNPRPCSTPAGRGSVPAGASHWEVVDGAISPCGPTAGYLQSTKTYKDLVLDVDFKTGEDTNSGVFIRSPSGILGYEVQIWKTQPAGYNTGSIVGAGKTARDFRFLPDQWNHYEITGDGDHLTVMLNGVKTLDVHDSKFTDGRLLLQYQKFPIEFKNIKLRPLKH